MTNNNNRNNNNRNNNRNNNEAEAMQDKMQKATERVVKNAIDRAAEEIGVYAETPISLSVTASSVATGSVGDIWVNVRSDSSAMFTNGAYRASVIDSTSAHSYFTPNLEHVYVPECKGGLNEDHEKTPAECNIPADEKDCRAGHSDSDGICPFEEKEDDHSEYKADAKVSEDLKQELKGCGKSEECKDCDGCNLPADSARSEFETEDKFHITSNEVIEALKNDEDVLVNTLTALQYLKKFERLEFDNFGVWKNGECCTNSSIEYVLANYFGVDKDDAKSIACEISDCVSLDVFKVIAKNKGVYIVAGDVETGIKTYDSNSSGEKSQVFIATVLVCRR